MANLQHTWTKEENLYICCTYKANPYSSYIEYLRRFRQCKYRTYKSHANRVLNSSSFETQYIIHNRKPCLYLGNGKYCTIDRLITNTTDPTIYVAHLDGDLMNNDVLNLYPVKRNIFLKVGRKMSKDPVYNKTLLIIAELEYELNERSKNDRKRKIREA